MEMTELETILNKIETGGQFPTEPKILSYTRKTVNGKVVIANRHTKDISNTLHASKFTNTEQYLMEHKQDRRRIRKLTPRECLRLMDVDDCDIDKMIAAGTPKTQLWKLAGNSIVVAVLYHILRKILIEKENESPQLTLF